MTDEQAGWSKKVKMYVTIASVVGATLTLYAGWAAADKLVLTEGEFDQKMATHVTVMHPITEEAFSDITRWNQCDRIERKIDTLQERLWAYRDDEARVHDLKAELKKLEQRFTDLKCAEVLGV